MNVLPRKVVIDASLVVDLYAAPTEEHASIAEELVTWIARGFCKGFVDVVF